MGITQILGVIVIALGIFLFAGNVSGLFRTFPGMGWVTIALGGVIFRAGKQQ